MRLGLLVALALLFPVQFLNSVGTHADPGPGHPAGKAAAGTAAEIVVVTEAAKEVIHVEDQEADPAAP